MRAAKPTEAEFRAEAARLSESDGVAAMYLEAAAEMAVELAHLKAADVEGWDNVDDEWTPAIHEAHPTRSGSHDEYGVAMRMVGNRHSKGKLLALVIWLLVRLREAGQSGKTGAA